jgi:LacI family gluconate utilization system Gnt-I transcriptional repressor
MKKRTVQDSSTASSQSKRTRRGSGNVTLREVALIAEVAPITASRAINSPHLVSPEVLQRVRQAVEKTGYVPNLLAGGLASRKSKMVAAVVPTIVGPVFLEMVQSLTDTLGQAGYQLMLGQSGYRDSREDALLEAIIGRRPDGIVLTGIMHSQEGRRRLINSGIPIVETWDLSESPIDMLVGFSHEQIGAAVAHYLHLRGKRKPAIISANDERAERRNKAFIKKAAEIGMDERAIPVCRVQAPTTLRSGREGLSQLLGAHPDIDAIFCSSDLLALGVMTEAQVRNIAIPDKLAVIGLGDLDFAKDLHPPLTTVKIDGRRIGQIAAQMIIDRADGHDPEQSILDIGFSIVERSTT